MTNATERARAIPPWVAVLYFSGLLVLFIGQRVVVEAEGVSNALSVAGALVVLLATGLRLRPALERSSEHRRVGQMLLGLQALGLVGLVVFFGSHPKMVTPLELEFETERVALAVAGVAWTTLIAVSSVALLFAEVALHPMRRSEHLESRRVAAAAASGAVLALAASYGSLFVFAASRTEAQADFSYFKTSEPGEATVKLLQKIGEPIQVTAFFPEVSAVRGEVKGYLTRLKSKAGNLEFKLVDRYLEPKLAKDLKATGDGTIVLSKGDNSETLRIGTELDKARSKLKTLDQDFHAELFKLLRTKRMAYLTVGHGELNDEDLGAGRDEGRSAEVFLQDLQHQNYRVKDLGLAQGLAAGVPEDAGIVMILGPIHPFAPEEIASIERYAKAGGKVLLALDSDVVATTDPSGLAPNVGGPAGSAPAPGKGMPAPVATAKATASSQAVVPAPSASATGTSVVQPAPPAASANPGAAAPKGESAPPANDWRVALARAVDVEFHPTPVADETKFFPRRNNPSDHAILFTNRFSSHASVSTLSRHSAEAAVLFNGAAHVSPLGGAESKAEVTLRTFASSFADTNRNFRRDDDERSESLNLGIAVSRSLGSAPKPPPEPKPEDESKPDGSKAKESSEEPLEMRAFVVADADVFSDLLMARFRNNRVLAADAVRWLGGEESLAGEFENEEDVTVEQSKQADVTWFYSSIFGVPLLVLGLGLFTSYRLRRGGSK